MNIIQVNNFAFRVAKTRYRANCAKEMGQFLVGDTKGLTSLEIEKNGLTKGSWVEMALCSISKKMLSFPPNYLNEEFLEVWGIPTAGKIKEAFNEKCSELSTFLLHRQSKDKMAAIMEELARKAFDSWVEDGMKGEANEYAIAKAEETYFSNIFRFELVKTEGKFGIYFYVKVSYRPPNTDFEEAALIAAKQIADCRKSGVNYCLDDRIEQNHQACLIAIAEGTEPVIALPSNSKSLSLKGK
ncbi:MAG: hypothetical protein ACRCT1_07400 [Microcoleaceae cyanobacterium]